MEAKSKNNTPVAVALNEQQAPTNTQKGASLPKSRNTSASTGIQIKLSNSRYYTTKDEDEESSDGLVTSTSEDDFILRSKKDATPKKASPAAPKKRANPSVVVEGTTAQKITLTTRTRVKRATRWGESIIWYAYLRCNPSATS